MKAPEAIDYWRAVTWEGRRRCVMRGRGRCRGVVDAHHVVSQGRINGAHHLDPEQRELAVRDERNGVAVCRQHHRWITDGAAKLRVSELSDSVWEFAREWGFEWSLDRDIEGLEAAA